MAIFNSYFDITRGYYQWLSSSQPPPDLLELCWALIGGDEDDLQILALFLHDVVKPGLQVLTLWILTGENGNEQKMGID